MPFSLSKAFKVPLSKDFYLCLLKLEQTIQTSFSINNLTKLTKMYSECVEYYDSQNDPIKIYFVEKIQTLLSGDKIFSKLKEKISPKISIAHRKNKSDVPNFRKFDQKDEYDSDQSPTTKCRVIQEEEIVSPQVPSATKIRRSRQRKMSLLIQLNKIQQESQENSEQIFTDYNENADKTENFIKSNLNEQENQIQERRKQRKSSLVSKRLSHESTSWLQFQEKQSIHFNELFYSLGGQ